MVSPRQRRWAVRVVGTGCHSSPFWWTCCVRDEKQRVLLNKVTSEVGSVNGILDERRASRGLTSSLWNMRIQGSK
jgi:hypothetical protein